MGEAPMQQRRKSRAGRPLYCGGDCIFGFGGGAGGIDFAFGEREEESREGKFAGADGVLRGGVAGADAGSGGSISEGVWGRGAVQLWGVAGGIGDAGAGGEWGFVFAGG